MIEKIEILRAIIGADEAVTFDQIREGVNAFVGMNIVPYGSEDIDMLIRHMEAYYTIKQPPSDKLGLEDENKSWLWNKKEHIDFKNGFWGRYSTFLKEKKHGNC